VVPTGTIAGPQPHQPGFRRLAPSRTITGLQACKYSVGTPVPFPEGMLRKQTTMSWGGDVARMIVGLVGNPGALGEAFTVSTSEHRAWGEVADIYRSVMPALSAAACGQGEFERAHWDVYQIPV